MVSVLLINVFYFLFEINHEKTTTTTIYIGSQHLLYNENGCDNDMHLQQNQQHSPINTIIDLQKTTNNLLMQTNSTSIDASTSDVQEIILQQVSV